MQVDGVDKPQDDPNPHNDIQKRKNLPIGGLGRIIAIPIDVAGSLAWVTGVVLLPFFPSYKAQCLDGSYGQLSSVWVDVEWAMQ